MTTTDLEPAALVGWRVRFGTEPTEPLRRRGGALDPSGYCMRLAEAVADGREEIPGYATNEPTPQRVVEAVAAALNQMERDRG